MRLSILIISLLVAGSGGQQNASCGSGTYFDSAAVECRCVDPLDLQNDHSNVIRLAGIFDTTTYDWGPDVFAVTVRLINEGWWNVLPEGTRLEYDLANPQCDETKAMRGYWDLRTLHGGTPPHGIVGSRCSGASMALARLSGLEGVPQLSPASNSPLLSNEREFPYFSRLVAPNDERGGAGAMVAMLRAFDWDRIGILATDTRFSKDSVTFFKKAWVGDHGDWSGQVAFSDTIRLTPDGFVDEDSVMQVLDHIPTDPAQASRVIMLVAHPEHAVPIMDLAHSRGFQPDTIWIAPSSWGAKDEDLDKYSFLPETPGFIGLAPFRNRDEIYQSFMLELQEYQRSQRKPVLSQLPTFATEFVDSIRALTKAIVMTDDRRDGESIVRKLRSLKFDGVSGRVEFTETGDRKDPQYSIFNAQRSYNSDGSNPVIWKDVGTTGVEVGSTVLTHGVESICFAGAGCGLSEAPDDMYPQPPYKLPTWAIFPIVFFVIVFIAFIFVTLKYRRSRQSKRSIRAKLEAFQNSVVGLRTSDRKYIPRVCHKKGDVEDALGLSGSVRVTPVATPQWMWKESEYCMKSHNNDEIFGDPKGCWILYASGCIKKIEAAYQKKAKDFSPLPGYTINFKDMKQTKVATGFKRQVQRVMAADADDTASLDLSDVELGDELPRELNGEPRMVLCEKDIIQISNQRKDGWAFGTKLHQTDEAAARQLVAVALRGMEPEEGSISSESGWFQLDKTRVPTPDELKVLQENVGDVGALNAPDNWDPVADPTVVQRHELWAGSKERTEVETAFLSTLRGKKIHILKVERIQNLAMWQTYVVKRQTVCYRETGKQAGGRGQDDDCVHRRAVERFERKWLFHGSNIQTMDKILQQGFNRSFCGKNGTAYGNGVYFARDASYSAASSYAVPDTKGRQYIMACRVVVGEFCHGKTNALTPDIRDQKSQSLYDSTVDNTANPSIYVTYHDSQAYPEYLITFKQG